MKEINFRTLRADEIEVRPATAKDGKVTLLLYIDSRAVISLMNETVGELNWEMVFEGVNGQTVGKLGIWDEEKNRFVYKSDTGSESNIEAKKGLFSDTYKRCLSRWGVTELYTSPKIVLQDDGYKCSGYKVSSIEYDENRKITTLSIVDRWGNLKYSWSKENPNGYQPVQVPAQPSASNYEILLTLCKALREDTNVNQNEVNRFFKYYEKTVNNWEGRFDVNKLWNKWQTDANSKKPKYNA